MWDKVAVYFSMRNFTIGAQYIYSSPVIKYNVEVALVEFFHVLLLYTSTPLQRGGNSCAMTTLVTLQNECVYVCL